MATMLATFALAGCEKEERNSLESSETKAITSSTTQEKSTQESEVQDILDSDSAIQETSDQKSIIEESSGVSSEESNESTAQSSEEESKPSEEEKYTMDEIKEILPIYSIVEDYETLEKLGKKDIVVYARFINESLHCRFKVGDIVGVLGKDEYDDCIFWISADGDIGLLEIEYFDYLKDYVPKEGELAE